MARKTNRIDLRLEDQDFAIVQQRAEQLSDAANQNSPPFPVQIRPGAAVRDILRTTALAKPTKRDGYDAGIGEGIAVGLTGIIQCMSEVKNALERGATPDQIVAHLRKLGS